MTSTLTRKLMISLVFLVLVTGVSADYYYEDAGTDDYSISQDTQFSVPQYESQEKILTKLVAPFLFLTVLLQVAFSRALRFAFVDESNNRSLFDLEKRGEPNVDRQAVVMAIAVTAMLIPTPFWGYVRLVTGYIGVGAVTAAAVGLSYLFYLWVKG